MLGEEQRQELMAVIERVDQLFLDGKSVKLDFRKVEFLHPCGTLVFLAHFDRWADLYRGRLFGTYPEDEVVEQLLQHVKVMERLGLEERRQVTHERVKFWHFKSGATANAAPYKDLATTVRDNIDHPQSALFADCLNEAVANSVGHAYDFERPWLPPKSHRKWWVLSLLKDDHVFVAIYDLGVSIPSSLRRKPEWADYLKLRPLKDSRLISLAVTSNRTSTKLPNRGKGLPEMLEFSQQLASGALSIASGNGAYKYDADAAKSTRYRLDCPVRGTLVLWQIPFRKERGDENNDLNS
ncbi:hypothetical protein [Achromobacter insolitus]|uniref:hypothetical protein n=1 Tax=Achromobacter insolitus TaxID=217204 RepID=UPI0011B04C03|nr:hypothetical protein [Achromobacter insolitus]